MNESEYITDLETSETSLSEDTVESDIEAVTEVNVDSSYGSASVSEVSEVSETTYVTTVSDYNHMLVLENNTSGILLMTTAIFFLLLIALIAKIFGGYFSM